MDKENKKCCLGEKPTHPNQVFGYPGDGVKLQPHSDIDQGKIRSFVTVGHDGKWMTVDYGEGPYVQKSMADSGMIPYETGEWNQVNWVVII